LRDPSLLILTVLALGFPNRQNCRISHRGLRTGAQRAEISRYSGIRNGPTSVQEETRLGPPERTAPVPSSLTGSL
jgi:hypothetical protein